MSKKRKTLVEYPTSAIKEAVISAGEELFPWEQYLSNTVKETMYAIANASNIPPEFILTGLLASISAAMGTHSKISPFEGCEEPLNIYVLCIGPPMSGKSAALQVAVIEPIEALVSSWSERIILDDFTREGLRKVMTRKYGRAVIASDEIGSLFEAMEKGTQIDRRLLCKLFDAPSWLRSTGTKVKIHF